jgi:hypothetical protein
LHPYKWKPYKNKSIFENLFLSKLWKFVFKLSSNKGSFYATTKKLCNTVSMQNLDLSKFEGCRYSPRRADNYLNKTNCQENVMLVLWRKNIVEQNIAFFINSEGLLPTRLWLNLVSVLKVSISTGKHMLIVFTLGTKIYRNVDVS